MKELPTIFLDNNIWIGYWDKKDASFEQFDSYNQILGKAREIVIQSIRDKFPRYSQQHYKLSVTTDSLIWDGCRHLGQLCKTLQLISVQIIPATILRVSTLRHREIIGKRILTCVQLHVLLFWYQARQMATLVQWDTTSPKVYRFQRLDGLICFQGTLRPVLCGSKLSLKRLRADDTDYETTISDPLGDTNHPSYLLADMNIRRPASGVRRMTISLRSN